MRMLMTISPRLSQSTSRREVPKGISSSSPNWVPENSRFRWTFYSHWFSRPSSSLWNWLLCMVKSLWCGVPLPRRISLGWQKYSRKGLWGIETDFLRVTTRWKIKYRWKSSIYRRIKSSFDSSRPIWFGFRNHLKLSLDASANISLPT